MYSKTIMWKLPTKYMRVWSRGSKPTPVAPIKTKSKKSWASLLSVKLFTRIIIKLLRDSLKDKEMQPQLWKISLWIGRNQLHTSNKVLKHRLEFIYLNRLVLINHQDGTKSKMMSSIPKVLFRVNLQDLKWNFCKIIAQNLLGDSVN